jgi:hypothetical protein
MRTKVMGGVCAAGKIQQSMAETAREAARSEGGSPLARGVVEGWTREALTLADLRRELTRLAGTATSCVTVELWLFDGTRQREHYRASIVFDAGDSVQGVSESPEGALADLGAKLARRDASRGQSGQ